MKITRSDNLICIATIVVKEAKLEEALSIFAELKELTPQEPGCLRYELHQDDSNLMIFTFIDRFANQEAFDYHCNQSYTIECFDKILPKLTESITITTHREIKVI